MTRILVSAVAGLSLMAGSVAPASAQSVAIGASIRVSDNLRIGVNYRRPYNRRVRVYDGYRWRWVMRDGRRHRAFALRHPVYLRQLEREHSRLVRGLRHGTLTSREHWRWHRAVGFTHVEFRRGLYRLVHYRADRVSRRRGGRFREQPRRDRDWERDRERDRDRDYDRERDRDRDRRRRGRGR